jgi:hypothetical protein
VSTPEPQPPALLPGRTVAALVCGLLLIGSLLGQYQLGLLPPSWILFAILGVPAVSLAVIATVEGLWRAARGPHRLAALGSVPLALAPLALLGYAGLYTQEKWRTRQVPVNFLTLLGRMTGISLMRGEAELFYPHCAESERLVMYHHGLATPSRDLLEMDEHVARMEKVLGERVSGKILWVRGDLLGQRAMSLHGLALGSSSSPGDWKGPQGYLDRHELAHALLDQQRSPGSDPPMVLHEGWAESQSGYDSATLGERALGVKAAGKAHRLRELVGPRWYHQDSGPVYSVGGALVDFLMRRYGVEKFLRLYVECRPDSFEADCRVILGVGLDELDAEFWKDAERTARAAKAPAG